MYIAREGKLKTVCGLDPSHLKLRPIEDQQSELEHSQAWTLQDWGRFGSASDPLIKRITSNIRALLWRSGVGYTCQLHGRSQKMVVRRKCSNVDFFFKKGH